MYASILLALASTAFAAPIAERGDAPSGWAHGYLEDYDVYHTRYIALDCQNQHNTTFFDDCCHPLLATENLADDRKAQCTPNATAISSASDFAATATVTASADVEAASEYSAVSSTWAAVESAAAAETSAVADADNNYAQKTSSTSAAAAAQTSEASSDNSTPSGDVKTGGHATYFYQGGNAGACGTVHSDYDKVIAIDSNGYWPDYASNNNSPYCGKWINIKNTNNGKTVTAMVADVCPTCDNNNSLDLSVGAFTAIASEGDGMVPIEWSWA